MSLHHTIFSEYANPIPECTNCATLEDEENTPLSSVGKHDLSCSDSCTATLLYKACTPSGQKDLKCLAAALFLLQEVQLERIPLEDYMLNSAAVGSHDAGNHRYEHMDAFREAAMAFLKQFGEPNWLEEVPACVDELREMLGGGL